MRRQNAFYLLALSFVLILSGCVVRTYPVTKDRTDQDLITGNRGYIMGEGARAVPSPERKTTRTVQAVEIELYPPIKFERMAKPKTIEKPTGRKTEDEELWGNRGFITESYTPEPIESAPQTAAIEKYTVKKGDTLQKISKAFYGTTKKWAKIYEANKDKLRGSDKIYPGQVIDIPVEALKEPQENLK